MTSPPIRKAILPAGGLGTRLRPLTHVMAKELLPVGGKVVLQYVLEECSAAGLDQILLVSNRQKRGMAEACEADALPEDPATAVPGRLVYTVNQERQLGLAHAILHGEPFVGKENFAVALADSIIDGGGSSLLARLIEVHQATGAVATIATEAVPPEKVSSYGIFEVDGAEGESFRVRGVVEKPDPGSAPSKYAICGRYVFSPVIFEACRAVGPGANGEIQLTDAITRLARQGATVMAVQMEAGQQRLDIGNPSSYFQAFALKAGKAV